jgi:hypothetical protein
LLYQHSDENGMPVSRWTTVLTGLSSTAGFQVYAADWNKIAPFNVVVAAILNSTATSPTYNIEITQDYTGSSTFIFTSANWFSSLASTISSNGLFALTYSSPPCAET